MSRDEGSPSIITSKIPKNNLNLKVQYVQSKPKFSKKYIDLITIILVVEEE